MSFLNKDTLMNLLFITTAEVVTKSDTVDLPVPGLIFIDSAGTEGNAKVTLLNGGEVSIPLVKGVPTPFLVKRVWSTGTVNTTIYVNPMSQHI